MCSVAVYSTSFYCNIYILLISRNTSNENRPKLNTGLSTYSQFIFFIYLFSSLTLVPKSFKNESFKEWIENPVDRGVWSTPQEVCGCVPSPCSRHVGAETPRSDACGCWEIRECEWMNVADPRRSTLLLLLFSLQKLKKLIRFQDIIM